MLPGLAGLHRRALCQQGHPPAATQIAHELDQLEHQLMREAGVDSHDFLKFMAEESGNVAGKQHPAFVVVGGCVAAP